MKRLLVLFASIFLTGCANVTAMPSPQPTLHRSTPTPSATATPGHIYHWDAKPVLIEVHESAGYTSEMNAWTILPKLVIYADGRVITTKDKSFSENKWVGTITIAHLSQKEICSLLSKIEEYGFFDFSMDEYVAPQVTDGGSTTISVQAWRSRSISPYLIDVAKNRPAALEKTYYLLSHYSPPNAIPYQIEQAALLTIAWPEIPKGLPSWPKTLPLLKKNVPTVGAGVQGVGILTGQEMTDTYQFFNKTDEPVWVDEDGVGYHLAIRPLLPFEIPASQPWSEPTFEESPTVPMSCESPAK